MNLMKRIELYPTKTDLTKTMVQKNGVFHKSCKVRFNKQMYERTLKSETKNVTEKEEEVITGTTKKGCNAKNFLVACFFCDKTDSADNLNECRTLYLDMRVRKIAHDSNNSQLIARLSEGDMVATEAKYHHTCLTKLYNQYRSTNRNRSKEMNELELIKGIALSELFAFIEDSIDSNDSIPVFLLKELKKFYQERLELNNAPEEFVKNVHSTRLNLKILEEIPGLREEKQGKDVVLTLDGEMGRAIFEACQYSSQDDGFILAKATKIIRKDLFEKDVSFNGDLSINKQNQVILFL